MTLAERVMDLLCIPNKLFTVSHAPSNTAVNVDVEVLFLVFVSTDAAAVSTSVLSALNVAIPVVLSKSTTNPCASAYFVRASWLLAFILASGDRVL